MQGIHERFVFLMTSLTDLKMILNELKGLIQRLARELRLCKTIQFLKTLIAVQLVLVRISDTLHHPFQHLSIERFSHSDNLNLPSVLIRHF